MMIGLERGKVLLQEHSARWHEIFEKERQSLLAVIGDIILDIQHVGSTAVQGLKAKPIIDIAAAVAELEDGFKCIKPLQKLGYEYKQTAGIPGRHFFAKGPEKCRTHYLHIEEINGDLWKNHILFRDYLILHDGARKEYQVLKERLAQKYKDEREEYTLLKDGFIKEVIARAEDEIRCKSLEEER